MKRFVSSCILVLSATVTISAAEVSAPADQNLFNPETGYRVSRYRAPTPDSVTGGTRVDIDALDRFVREGAVLIDVMVAEGAGPHPRTGAWRLSKPHKSLPKAVWLADVGKGELSPELETYYARNLKKLTGGDKNHPIIIFCMADCWMSWNAVKRAARLGYTRIYWYPEGTDGWRDWDRSFVVLTPQPVERVRLAEANRTASPTPNAALPKGQKTATLITHDGTRQDIANVSFKPANAAGRVAFEVKLIDAPFQDEFLSMRPFRCLPDTREMWCHLAYPYASKQEIHAGDLQDLEYALLFLFKPPKGYGIDAWNGLYFKLALENDGGLTGKVHETDMNVLAVPPDDGVMRPISHDALTEVEPDAHRFATIEIR